MDKHDQVIQALAYLPNLMLNGVVTIQDVIDELKKPEEWAKQIEEAQKGHCPVGDEEETTIKFLSGVWCGLELAYEIVTGGKTHV